MFLVAVRTTGDLLPPDLSVPHAAPPERRVPCHDLGCPGRRVPPVPPMPADGSARHPPTTRRGPERELVITRIETPIGTMVAAAVDEGIAVLDFADRRATRTALRNASHRLKATPTIGRHPHLDDLASPAGRVLRRRPDDVRPPAGPPRDAVRAIGLDLAADHPGRRDPDLRRRRRGRRSAAGGPGHRSGQRPQPGGDRRALPPGHRLRRRPDRLRRRPVAQARPPRPRGASATR